MRARLLAVPLLLALPLLLTGCEREAEADTAKDQQAIRDLERQRLQSMTSRDLDAFANFYADDARFLGANSPELKGREAIRETWKQFLATPNLTLTFEPVTIEVAEDGDMAYELGRWQMTVGGPQPVDDVGKNVIVWKKVNGQWKIAVDIFNSDKPAAPPPPPSKS